MGPLRTHPTAASRSRSARGGRGCLESSSLHRAACFGSRASSRVAGLAPIAPGSSRIGKSGLRFDIHLQGARRRSSSSREPVLGDLRPRRPGRRALRPRLARRVARRGACARQRGGAGGPRSGCCRHRRRRCAAGSSASTTSMRSPATAAPPAIRSSHSCARIRARLDEEHAGFVHLGATSQDILDSAAMLVARGRC